MVLLRILQHNLSFLLEIILLFTLIHPDIRATKMEDYCWGEKELILPLICTNSDSSPSAWLLPLLSQRQEMAAWGDELEHSAYVPAPHHSGMGQPPPSLGSARTLGFSLHTPSVPWPHCPHSGEFLTNFSC